MVKKMEKDKTIEQIKNNCFGCTACYSICPKKAISMIEDDKGFLYPKIDKSKCINCGLCQKVCPVLNTGMEEKNEKSRNNNIS